MNIHAPRRWFRGDRSGSTTLEFALVAGILVTMLFGTTELGLLMWTRNVLQSTASLTARCVALGSSLCATPTQQVQFAVNAAQQWGLPGIITTNVAQHDVTVTAVATSCNGIAAGSVTTVLITSPFWATGILPPPFSNVTLTTSSCYPTAN
jgi:Flp pilus assembly protein TadG